MAYLGSPFTLAEANMGKAHLRILTVYRDVLALLIQVVSSNEGPIGTEVPEGRNEFGLGFRVYNGKMSPLLFTDITCFNPFICFRERLEVVKVREFPVTCWCRPPNFWRSNGSSFRRCCNRRERLGEPQMTSGRFGVWYHAPLNTFSTK
jgi:hypothetical protein